MSKQTKLEFFETGDFEEYAERLEFYFIANAIGQLSDSPSWAEKNAAEKRKAAVLISQLSASAYTNLKNLCLPEKPGAKKYSELVQLLTTFYRPPVSAVAATHLFCSAEQKDGERIVEFAARLNRLAVDCKFGEHLDRGLRDQFIKGLRSQAMTKEMLSKAGDTDTYAETVKRATLFESAAKDAAKFEPAGVHTVKTRGRTARSSTTGGDKSASSTHRSTAEKCFRCDKPGHKPDDCYFKRTECRYCKRQGHIERACQKKQKRRVKHIQTETDDDTTETGEIEPVCVPLSLYYVNGVAGSKVGPYVFDVEVNGMSVEMEIDTGSPVTILNENDFVLAKGDRDQLGKPTLRMQGYTGQQIECLGEMSLPITVDGVCKPVLVRVVRNGPSLMGRDMLSVFKMPWNLFIDQKVNRRERVHHVNAKDLVDSFPKLFDTTKIGKLNTAKITLHVDESAPVFCRARPVPFSIREKYEESLDALVKDGVLKKVDHSKWASPTVPVEKPNGKIRLCGDYSMTVNKHSECEHYPLPTLEELREKLAGGCKFTKLDLSQAYHQLELDEQSRVFTTISTHRGLFEYTRLPFGINSAVSIFQRTIENVLVDLPGSIVYIDDILVTGANEQEHIENLKRVLARLQEVGLKLRPDKVRIMEESVTYLGHRFSANGMSPTSEKVTALRNAKPPTCVAELQSFIGSATYLSAYMPKFAGVMAPLYTLLKKDVPWHWGQQEEEAFRKVKEMLTSNHVLANYYQDKELILQTDASGKGLGAVLLQPDRNGVLRPISFKSRVLTKAEQNYSQIEREALAIVFGTNKFQQYLLGRQFELRTDHKPLLAIFDPLKPVPAILSNRLKKWRLSLAAYNFTISHIPGKSNTIADFLSRSPVDGIPTENEMVTEQVLFISKDGIVDAALVAQETKSDPVLSKVLHYTRVAWPVNVPPEWLPYHSRRFELTVEGDVLLWNDRVIIPSSLQNVLLGDLHSDHMGIVRMKRVARRYLWWPNLDSQLEGMVKLCVHCQANARNPPKSYGTWTWPAGPWRRIHLDFAGPYLGKMFLVIIDAHTKYLDIVPMAHATTNGVIDALRHLFATFGLPEHLVSDNGSQFTSDVFQRFLRENGIHHTRTAPGHPATNGLAERYVGYFKEKMKLLNADHSDESLHTKLCRFLSSHRTTPLQNGKTPAELMLNRQPRTRYEVLRPSETKRHVELFEKSLNHQPEFSKGQPVFVLNYGRHGAKWLPGVVLSTLSSFNYQVQVGDSVWKRHRNQLRVRSFPTSMVADEPRDADSSTGSSFVEPVLAPVSGSESSVAAEVQQSDFASTDLVVSAASQSETATPSKSSNSCKSVVTPRRSERQSRPPDRLITSM